MEMGKHSMNEEEEKKLSELGLHTITHTFEREINETITKIIDGSLRSGKKVEFQGSVVIIGDINAGAEVIAKENIIVLGAIRGLAHAGAKGNKKAMIFANEIVAPQIRIADIVKEKEMPVTEEEPKEDEKLSYKDKRKLKKKEKEEQDEEEEFEEFEDVKTRAYIQGKEIILE